MSHKILFQLCQVFSLGSNVLVGGHLFLDHEPVVAPNITLFFFLQTLNFLSAFLITGHNTISTQLLHNDPIYFKDWIPPTIPSGWSRQMQPINKDNAKHSNKTFQSTFWDLLHQPMWNYTLFFYSCCKCVKPKNPLEFPFLFQQFKIIIKDDYRFFQVTNDRAKWGKQWII